MANRLRVTTESGSVYVLDTERNLATREPAEGASQLENDRHEHYFEAVTLKVGEPMLYTHYIRNGVPTKARFTTPVVSIEDL